MAMTARSRGETALPRIDVGAVQLPATANSNNP